MRIFQSKLFIYSSLLALFFLSRAYVLANPPYVDSTKGVPGHGYSDVKHDSERYANMWYYGLTPYRKHLYEYPPIAIPFVYVPLLVDKAGIGHYYPDYRFQIFLFDTLLFFVLLKTTSIIWKKQSARLWLAMFFYILIGFIGKDFWYDGLDLLFIGFYTMALCLHYLTGTKHAWQKILFWALFSASFGVKYMTLPLALPLLWLKRKEWKQEIICGLIGFLIVWGIPIALYRSSLTVMVYFHTARPFNYGAFGKWLALTINDFTHTEIQTDILPHLPLVGPVSQTLEKIFEKLFIVSIFASIGWSTWRIHKENRQLNRDEELRLLLNITLFYFMSIFLSNKIFSNPFHIWYIPLIVLMPLGSLTEHLLLMIGAAWMFMVDTTPWIRVPPVKAIGPITLNRIRDFTRFIPMFAILGWELHQLRLPSLAAKK